MTHNLQPTLFNVITGSSNPAADIHTPSAGEASLPSRPTKLKEGWYNTEKYREVYVSPGGIAWVVQRNGNKLESVAVKLLPSDIIKAPAIDRVKRNLADRQRRKSRVVDVSPPILAASVVSKANDGVIEVVK